MDFGRFRLLDSILGPENLGVAFAHVLFNLIIVEMIQYTPQNHCVFTPISVPSVILALFCITSIFCAPRDTHGIHKSYILQLDGSTSQELLENSLDAGSRRIVILVKSGGLKMLRIEDDGHGIRHQDLPILCERFTTSKLKNYDDLLRIGTFGFRGEALASISHVAQVTVTTMTSQDSCASVAHYSEGQLKGQVRPCAGTRGTTVVVENMFYNNPTRRQALGKESLEHARVLEVVQRYSIHYPHVAFGCRKCIGSTGGQFELSTTGGEKKSTREVIGTIWGQNLANEVFPFELTSQDPSFSCKGFASNLNYSARTSTLILFINNRLVECPPLKRAIEAVYQPVLPRHQHPWVYLALEVEASSIDVNVHPTKMEVQFLHEETISQRLQETLSLQFRNFGGTRTFSSILPSQGPTSFTIPATPATPAPAPAAPATPAIPKVAAPKATRIRTDHRQLSLDSVFREATQATQAAQAEILTTQSGEMKESQMVKELELL